MKRLLLFAVIALISYNKGQTFEWVKVSPIPVSTNPTYLTSPSAIDKNGNPVQSNIVELRLLYGSEYFGNTAVVKRNQAGEVIWEKMIYGNVDLFKIDFDSQNHIYCIGNFKDTMYIDPGQPLFSSNGDVESFIFKLDNSGNLLWLKSISQLLPGFMELSNLEIDNADNLWLALNQNFINSVIKKLDPSLQNTLTITQTEVRFLGSLSVDNIGNVWAAGGTFNGSQSFNGYVVSPPYSYNNYVVKYSPDGSPQWVRFVEDVTIQKFEIITDLDGNAYLSGNIFDSTYFGSLKAYGPNWVYDYVLTKIDASGNFVWLKEVPYNNTLGDATIGNGNFMSYSNGNIYLAGFFRNTVDFGNGIVVQTAGSRDLLVVKYSETGELLWAKSAGGISDDPGSSIAADNNGNCYISGIMGSSASFDTITANGIQYNFYFAKLSDVPVPVELISFTADIYNNNVELKWVSATETNNKGFYVERRSDGSPWESIGFIEGKGTSSENQNYSFLDGNVLPGINSYRLKQIDFDGTFEYSKEIEINIEHPVTFSLNQNYPNPFNPFTTINYSVPNGNTERVKIIIFDMLGNEIKTLVNDYQAPGNYNIKFNAVNLSSGIYFYKLSAGNFSETRSMILLK